MANLVKFKVPRGFISVGKITNNEGMAYAGYKNKRGKYIWIYAGENRTIDPKPDAGDA